MTGVTPEPVALAAELQVRAPGPGPWILAWLAATVAAEALIAPFAFLPGQTWLSLFILIVAVVAPAGIAIGADVCRRQARRQAVTRSDVMSVFVATGFATLVGLPSLIALLMGLAVFFETVSSGVGQALVAMLTVAVIAEVVGLALGIIPAVLLAFLSGWIVSHVAFRPVKDG